MEISVIVPVYNEEKNISPFLARLLPVLQSLKVVHEIIFCLDPCQDDTEQVIRQVMKKHRQIKLLTLSRRFGQPAATMAGIAHAKGHYTVVIDVDLQDPPELIKDMYQKCCAGFDVTYAQRSSRDGETSIKRLVAALGYRLIRKLSDCPIPVDTGDYRMMSKRVTDKILQLKDQQGFLRGLVAYVGFKQVAIPYHREERHAGNTKYNRFTGSLDIGMNGLVGFSRKLLSIVFIPATILMTACFGWAAYTVAAMLMGKTSPSGTDIIILLLCLFSGLQLFGIGILGEYLGRLYMERDSRPLYITQSFESGDQLD